MTAIRVVTRDQARNTGWPAPGCETRAFISGASDPLHLRQHTLAPGARLPVAGTSSDRLGYVLDGEVALGGLRLEQGSSFVIERGAAASVTAGPAGATIAEFYDAEHRAATAGRKGGRVHVMPSDTVPRLRNHGTTEMGAALHADAACPTCTVWLHEHDFHAAVAGVVPLHPHPGDQIIFVTAGSMRLGNRTYGPRTAIAVAANTLYVFDVLAGGLSVVVFRIGPPMATTQTGPERMGEAEFWPSRVGKPQPIQVAGDI